MFDVDNAFQGGVKSTINCDIRHNGEFKLVEVFFDRRDGLDFFSLFLASNGAADTVAGL
jgi:hypothetical protein